MELKTYFAQDQFGNIIPNASVTMYLTGTDTFATGLEDANGNPLLNPFTADANAKIAVKAPNGIYDLVTASSVYTAPRMTVEFIDGQDVINAAAQVALDVITAGNSATASAASAVSSSGFATNSQTSATASAASAVNSATAEAGSENILSECQSILEAIQTATITDEVFYPNPPSDPDGTIAGLAGTTVGQGFFVVQGANVTPAFKFYQHMSDGTAQLWAQLPGQQAIDVVTALAENNVNQVATFSAIPANSVGFWMVETDETKNIGMPTFYYLRADGKRFWFAMNADN
jgi:hypothetical protein